MKSYHASHALLFYLSLAFTAAPCGYWPVTSFTPLLLLLS